jgi:hypothetical protein
MNEVSKKFATGISAIKRIRNFVPLGTIVTVYNGLVQPYFNYCSMYVVAVTGASLKNVRNYKTKLHV